MDDDADAKKILTASPLEEIRWWSLDYLDEDSHIWPQVPRAHVDSSSQRGSHSGVCWLRVVQERNNDENDDQGDLIQTTWNSLTLPWWFAALLCGTRHVTCYWYQRYWRSRLAISAKLKLYNTCILPIFLYGTDCWAISKTDVCKIDALDQWCLRMLLGIKWYQLFRNDDVCRLTKQPKLTAIIQLCRVTLFGHIMRMDDNADDKRILLASPPADWRRQPGRPRITWLSTVQQDLKQHHLTLPEAADFPQNRPLWRMMSTYGATQS